MYAATFAGGAGFPPVAACAVCGFGAAGFVSVAAGFATVFFTVVVFVALGFAVLVAVTVGPPGLMSPGNRAHLNSATAPTTVESAAAVHFLSGLSAHIRLRASRHGDG